MTAAGQSPRPVVVDASVVLKWQLDDEEATEQAMALRDDLLVRRQVTAYAPTLLIYEVINGIVSAVRRRRVDADQGSQALRNVFSAEIVLRTPLADRIYSVAHEHDLSGYDSSYVALMEQLGADFWTADRQLFNAASTTFRTIRWIGDYPV